MLHQYFLKTSANFLKIYFFKICCFFTTLSFFNKFNSNNCQMEFLLTLASFSIWLYLLFFYSNKKFSFQDLFWTNKMVFENELIKKKNQVDNLCIIIPARNEELYIPETLRSISNLNFSKKSVLIIDDNSTDDTVKISKNILNKKKIQNFILKGKTLPKGWSGKVWALKQGIDFLKKKKIFILFIFRFRHKIRKKCC